VVFVGVVTLAVVVVGVVVCFVAVRMVVVAIFTPTASTSLLNGNMRTSKASLWSY
jgi:hypothetical protein